LPSVFLCSVLASSTTKDDAKIAGLRRLEMQDA